MKPAPEIAASSPEPRWEAHEVAAPGSCIAVVLAGGMGSRLRASGNPELVEVPKVLVPIDFEGYRQPMLEYVLGGLIGNGFSRVAVITSGAPGSDSNRVEAFVHHRYQEIAGVRVVREEVRNGTAGAVYAAANSLPGEILLVVPADTLFPFHLLGGALAAHRASGEPFTWTATSVADDQAQNAGALLVDPATRLLMASREDSVSETGFEPMVPVSQIERLTSAGAVILDKDAFLAAFRALAAATNSSASVDLHRDLLPFAARTRRVRVHDLATEIHDLGVPDRLFARGRQSVNSTA